LEAHTAVAALHLPQVTLDAVLDDWTTANIPEKTRGALKLLEFMTVHPQDINSDLIDELRKAGLSKLAIQEAANVGFHYSLIDRVADAFDFPVPQGVAQKRLARMLNITGRLLSAPQAEEDWAIGEGEVIRPPEVEKGRSQLLSVPGATDPNLRRAVEAYVVAQRGMIREDALDLPPELENYLKKLSLYAYRIVDEDIKSLNGSGYSDEMIYEITLVGAVGAALVGLESVYKYLYGPK
jgi:alkylhydroperoxidase family enzyme